jgi:predicted lipid-binding transport protein (Tim44 family)
LLLLALALGANVVLAKGAGGAALDAAPPTAKRAGATAPAALAAPVAVMPVAAPSVPATQGWVKALSAAASAVGLVWLSSSLAGQSWLQMLVMVALLLGGGLFLRWFLRRGTEPLVATGMLSAAGPGTPLSVPKGYSVKNVGNDASARPWESLPGAQRDEVSSKVPEGFDVDAFLKASKLNFVNLQHAWDRSDVASLRAMMTDPMLAEIQAQLIERERSGVGQNKTEVVTLEARLLGLEDQEEAYLASVEFSGLIREDPSLGPNPFREIWNINRPKVGASGWLVSGVQALQ